jgi:hypothetical protein
MKDKIIEKLKDYLLEVEQYEVHEDNISNLDKKRVLKDIEEYGITSSYLCYERLFVFKNNKITEKNIKRYKLRKKDYGKDSIKEEEGNPVEQYIDGTEDAVIIAYSIIDTKPKGPHIFKKGLEIFYK